MTDDHLKLFCLVSGEPTSHAFPVKTSADDTIGDLKKLIKTEKAPRFDDVAADELTLWRVSIPIPDDDDELPILLGAINDKKKLGPATRLSKLFPEEMPEETIHIFVQRPQSAHAPPHAHGTTPLSTHAWDASRPATPIRLKAVPMDHIEKELAVVLKGVSHHHITDPVDPKDVEASQRKKLGPFYKRTLPYHKTATDTSLVMLGLELDKQARTTDGETLRSIVEDDIGKFSDHRVVALVAPSGSGKTATVIDLASKHFVVYCVCCSPSPTISPGFNDPNFVTLAKDVERIYRNIIDKRQGALCDPQDIDLEVKALVGERVELEFLARLLFLQLLLNDNSDLEPLQFFREQTTGGASTIRDLVYKLRDYDILTIQAMLGTVQAKIRSLLIPRRLGLVVALDEAQHAVNGILAGKLIAPSALVKNRDTLFDSKNQIQSKFRRGFLTPLSATLSNMQATLVILGTALSLQDADHVYSAIAKNTNFSRITDFPQFTDDDVDKILSDLVDMSGCDIPPAKRRKLTGRARFSIDVVNRLAAPCSFQDSKQATLIDAVDQSIEHTTNSLRTGIRTILDNDITGEAARLLGRMVLAYHLQDAKISFSSNQQSDFVDKALCRLRPHSDGIHLVMDEPMVIEAVQEELKASNKDPEFSEYLDQIYRIVTNLGATSTSKGAALELLARRSLQRFNGFHLKDLPFLQGITLPAWCDDFQLQIDSINTASGFGYTASGVAADLEFLMDCPPNKMLVAYSGTRPDGAWFFSDKRYAGSLAIKLYSDSLPQDKHNENETSSDIRRCFLKKDGITVNTSLADLRQTFETSGIPSNIKGILRIHLEFPNVTRPRPVTHVRRDTTTGVEDVMVYIDISNMDSFFDERVAGNAEDMVKLKRLIKFVCNSV
ncbi:hypothetical protein BGZ68_000438 [Mortierella alpina]|nr:hypothetical protein BGZ68_000438 [Mortierella alpina]